MLWPKRSGEPSGPRRMKVTWSARRPNFRRATTTFRVLEKYQKFFRSSRGTTRETCEPAFSQAAKTFEATYHWPFQMHGMIGPSCAVADVQGRQSHHLGRFAGNVQYPQTAWRTCWDCPNTTFMSFIRESSGCYGQIEVRTTCPLDAALMSRAVGKPVRVQWMREDEHAWEPKGPRATDYDSQRHRRARQSDRLGIHGPHLSVDRRMDFPCWPPADRASSRTPRET